MLKQISAIAMGLGLAIALGTAMSLSAYSGELRSTKKQVSSKTESAYGWNKPNRYKTSRRHARWGHRYQHLR